MVAPTCLVFPEHLEASQLQMLLLRFPPLLILGAPLQVNPSEP